MGKGKRPVGAFAGVVIFAFIFYGIMMYLQEQVLNTHLIPNYAEMESGMAGNRIGSWILWILGDMSEANFFKSYLAGAGLITGSLLAHYLYRKKSNYQGISIAYGSGRWPWMLGASAVSLVLSNLIYGWNIAGSGWFPTFVVFVSVPAATILIYGGGFKNLLTGAIAGAVLVVPLSRLVMVHFCEPTGVPGVAGSVFGMWAGGIIAFEIFRLLPWMHLSEQETQQKGLPDHRSEKPARFFVRRIIADFSEPCFAGNELAGAGLIIGLLISWFLCPELPVYGSGTIPAVLLSQFLTGAVAVFVYWEQWMERDWFPSFPSMVSVAPAVAWIYDGSVWAAVLAAVLGGLICPAVADLVIRKIPSHWPAVIGTTFSMTAGTVAVSMFLICAKGIIPGI